MSSLHDKPEAIRVFRTADDAEAWRQQYGGGFIAVPSDCSQVMLFPKGWPLAKCAAHSACRDRSFEFKQRRRNGRKK